jgi:hypothetical protein
VVVGALLALQTHVLLLVGVGETVLEHAVHKGLVAKLCTSAQVGEVVGGIRHALGTTSHDNVGISGDDGLSADDEGFDRGGADFVYRGGDGGIGKACANGNLAGRVLTKTVCSCKKTCAKGVERV